MPSKRMRPNLSRLHRFCGCDRPNAYAGAIYLQKLSSSTVGGEACSHDATTLLSMAARHDLAS